MTRSTKPEPVSPGGKRPAGSKGDASRARHGVRGGTCEANRMAVVILEVLAGARSPAEAAAALKISLPRYYLLETRALEGMIAACEPKPKGKQPLPQTRIAALEKELAQARRECARQQALVRVAQRSIGLPAAEPTQKAAAKRDHRGRKRRRPAVRALKAAEVLRDRLATAGAAGVEQAAAGEPAPASGHSAAVAVEVAEARP
jgi:hypothetical protein